MRAKFDKGNPVRLNHRAPAYIIDGARQRTRTIVAIFPTPEGRRYYLAGRGKSLFNHWNYAFRSYQLDHAPHNPPNGRPRTKRRYRRHTIAVSNS